VQRTATCVCACIAVSLLNAAPVRGLTSSSDAVVLYKECFWTARQLVTSLYSVQTAKGLSCSLLNLANLCH